MPLPMDAQALSSAAADLRAVHRNDLLGAINLLFLQNHQRNATENSDGRQYQAQRDGLTEEYDGTQGRNDRHTELHCRSIGSFQRR